MAAVHPDWAVPGSRIRIDGSNLPVAGDGPPRVHIGGALAHVVAASATCIRAIVPPSLDGGVTDVAVGDPADRVATVHVGRTLATGLHQVDSPAFDGLGRLYVTHSGSRGVKVPVPIYRLNRDGDREPVAVDQGTPCLRCPSRHWVAAQASIGVASNAGP